MAKNKIKYGIKNAHFALLTIDANGAPHYGAPQRLDGAVSLSLSPKGESSTFYADDMAYYVTNNNQGYEGDFELALIPENFRTQVLRDTVDSNGVIVENSDATSVQFALMFEFNGDQKKIRHVLYNCTAARPGLESQTREDSIEVKTEKLSLVCASLDFDGKPYVKAATGANTDSSTYNSWFSAVYTPTSDEFGVAPATLAMDAGGVDVVDILAALGAVTAAVTKGSSASTDLTVAINGASATINAGASASGEYTVTFTDAGRDESNTASVAVTVTAAPEETD